ncbi:DNA-processing protein DprA [Crateriforma conspicua]|uniref:Uncharacterized protein n=1 Tax=Crateriforma conspicua TaxID=2527996 RepID=A0A5C6FMF3_9PLAN|nr:DNA-processing protein DprA [Crateriforma conspicua]TWU63217.1 hypothetical protein V7x_49570 [Crateriforma conspicua]
MDESIVDTDQSPAAPASASLRDLLQLVLLPGLGPRTLARLLERFGTATKVLSADGEALACVPNVGRKLVHTIRTAGDHVCADEVLRWCDDQDVRLVRDTDADYPMGLKDLDDAPPLLFLRGDWVDQDQLSVAIVGTRHATTYGLKQAERLAFGLAKAGITVVSGLARGIDTAAHRGCLDGGGRTMAVLGGGLGEVYPAENKPLADRCSQSGAVISEQPPYAKPRSGHFPQRNRLIAAMSLATLVIEAPDRSGSLITARQAYELNRDVLALPGPVTSRTSRGCNQLIRDGAVLVQTVDDVLEAIGPMSTPVTTDEQTTIRSGAELQLNDIERSVLQAIAPESTSIDTVIAQSGLPAHRVISTISVLEMRRLIRRLSSQYVARI